MMTVRMLLLHPLPPTQLTCPLWAHRKMRQLANMQKKRVTLNTHSECLSCCPSGLTQGFSSCGSSVQTLDTTLRIFKLMCAIIFESHKLYDKEKHREESCANLWSNSVAWGVPIPYWAREGSPLVLKSLHPVWGRSHYLLNTSMFYSF